MSGGLLKTTDDPRKGFLPVEDTDKGDMYRAGDERANENPGLSSLHTIFVRDTIGSLLESFANYRVTRGQYDLICTWCQYF